MKVLEIIGLLFAFGIIYLIDKPKLKATANKKNTMPFIILFSLWGLWLVFSKYSI